MDLQVSTEKIGAASVVTVGHGDELDLHTAPILTAELERVIESGADLVVVDLSPVDFMDSTGLSVMVAAVAALRETGGELRVVSDSDKITKIFRLTGVDQHVGIFGSVKDALG